MPVAGKTDLYLLKMSGKGHNHSRLTLDLRNLNKFSINKPKINLPSYETLAAKFKNHHVTTCDLTSQFWAISNEYESQHLTNFFFDHHVYSFCRLPMGWTNASFVAQRATEMTYSQETMLKFIKMKGWTLDSDEWPFKNVSEFVILY